MAGDEAKKPDLEHLAWAIEERAEIQRTILALYRIVRRAGPSGLTDPVNRVTEALIAAAFSLWRAVFLAEAFRSVETVHRSQEAFLEKLITDNAIGFTDDKVNRHWTVEYYLENAKLRLGRIAEFADHHLKTNVTQEVIQNLRLRGTMGVDLTRYEWECAHYALRVILVAVLPQSGLQPKRPTSPKPKGLEPFFKDE